MSPTPTTTANQMQPMTSTASSTANQNANRSVGTTWANGNTGKVNIDLANLGKPVQQKKSASMNELKSQMPSSGNPGMPQSMMSPTMGFMGQMGSPMGQMGMNQPRPPMNQPMGGFGMNQPMGNQFNMMGQPQGGQMGSNNMGQMTAQMGNLSMQPNK